MSNLARRFVRKCMQRVSDRPIPYEKQKKILLRVINELETKKISVDALDNPIVKSLDKVDNRTILENVSMADMPFVSYLFYLKYRGNIGLVPQEQDCVIEAGGEGIANMSYLASYIHFLDIKENELYIEGNVSFPTVFKENIKFCVKMDDEKIPVEMYDAGLDLRKGENVYETRTAYVIKFSLQKDVNKITFYNTVNGNDCAYGRINSMRFSPVADCIGYQYCVRDGWLVYIEGNTLNIERASEERIKEREKLFQDSIKLVNKEKANWAIDIRNEYFESLSKKKKPVWLFMDRIDRAGDNAEVLFRYARQKKEVDSYFIIEEGTKDYERLSPLGNVVKLNSKEHYLLVLLADYIISSQSNGVVENPFWEDAEFFRDLYHQGKIIFLQHGVTKDDMSCTMNRFNSNYAAVITSGVGETESFIGAPYFYGEEQVWLTGMPRFDALYDNKQQYILIMPSWRKCLMEQVWDKNKNAMVWKVKENFVKSEYVKRYSRLLRNKKLQKVCNEYGYKLVFMPHALMEPYIDKFVQNEHCIYWDSKKLYTDAFAEGNLMITDYSSVAFDFAYLGKPVIYYQYDSEQFFSEHTYTKGYYDYYKDGFGEVMSNEKEMVDLIIEYIKNECRVKDIYSNRINSFFKYRDEDCCKRVYERLIKKFK